MPSSTVIAFLSALLVATQAQTPPGFTPSNNINLGVVFPNNVTVTPLGVLLPQNRRSLLVLLFYDSYIALVLLTNSQPFHSAESVSAAPALSWYIFDYHARSRCSCRKRVEDHPSPLVQARLATYQLELNPDRSHGQHQWIRGSIP